MKRVNLSPGELEVAKIRAKLQHFTIQKQPDRWLIPTSKYLVEVFGDPERGIPYGKIYEACGRFSGGKTAIVQELAAEAQTIDGAHVAWIDLERSYDEKWAIIRGLDTSKVAVFAAEILTDKKGRNAHVAYAEEVFNEAECWVKTKFAQDSNSCFFIGVDSTTGIQSQMEEEGGLEGRARGTGAAFLSKMLRRWASIVATHNVMFVLINQIRVNPGVSFGDPEYRPGGNSLDHWCSVIVKVKRPRGKGHGFIFTNGKPIGIRGTILNQKNKVGGSEGTVVGHKIYWAKRAKFVPASEVE